MYNAPNRQPECDNRKSPMNNHQCHNVTLTQKNVLAKQTHLKAELHRKLPDNARKKPHKNKL
jgi:hypothetical protein